MSGDGVRFSDPREICAKEYQEFLEGKATLAFSLKDSKCIIICTISFVVMSSPLVSGTNQTLSSETGFLVTFYDDACAKMIFFTTLIIFHILPKTVSPLGIGRGQKRICIKKKFLKNIR